MVFINQNLPKPMTKEEKEKLYENWDGDSYKILAERNMRLATEMTKSFRNTGIDDEDLLSIALVGLVKAAKNFNPVLGYEFSTYAIPSIRNEILIELRRRKNHPYPNESLNEPAYDYGEGKYVERGDLVKDSFDLEEFIVGGRMEEIISTEICKENERNRKIIALFLNGTKQMRIGNLVGVSQAQVSRITNKFRDKVIKKYMK